MRVFVDCRMLEMSGIGRYVKDILAGLAGLEAGLEFILAGHPGQVRAYLEARAQLREAVLSVVPFRAPIYSVAEQVYGSALLARLARTVDLFFFPHYNVPWLVPGPLVVTVHDMIHFKFPGYFGRHKVVAAALVLRRSVRQARRVIAVSCATAQDLANSFPEASERVHVVHEFPTSLFSPPTADEVRQFCAARGLDQYILYVGNRKPHKNLPRLLRAFAFLRSKDPTLQLVLAGRSFAAHDEVAQEMARLGLQGVVEIENCTDEELRILYAGAQVLVLPSLYEGFGLPPLEAMACGTPVVVSNVASLPEVVGDAGIYVDPYDVEDIARGIYHVLTDEKLRQRLREKGLARARLFTWEKSARDTLKVFEEAVQNHRSGDDENGSCSRLGGDHRWK